MSALARRQWMATLGGAAVGGGLAWALDPGGHAPSQPRLIRPPGASPEKQFLAACIRCGQCVLACPYDTLRLAPLSAGRSGGTPFADDLRHRPCYLCQKEGQPQCSQACPTTALSPVASLLDIRMGVATIDPQTCWAFQGVVCRSCWHACPWPNQALSLSERLRPIIHSDLCVGCGLCEHACPTEPGSITVHPGPREPAGQHSASQKPHHEPGADRP